MAYGRGRTRQVTTPTANLGDVVGVSGLDSGSKVAVLQKRLGSHLVVSNEVRTGSERIDVARSDG